MAYATIADVQARIPAQVWAASPVSQPNLAVVNAWLEADAGMISGAFAWKYSLPLPETGDLAALREANADLTAARVWSLLAGNDPSYTDLARSYRTSGLSSIGYSATTGRASLVLPNSSLSESGEADIPSPEGSFTDPDSCWTEARLFPDRLEF